MVAGFGLRIALGALLTDFRPSQGEGKTKRFTPEDSVPLLGMPPDASRMSTTPSQQAVFLLFWVLKRFAGLGGLLRQMQQLIGHK